MDHIAEPGKYVEALQAENAKLRATVEALKTEIGGRSRITEGLQFQYEQTVLQVNELKKSDAAWKAVAECAAKERDDALRLNDEWEKLVRAAADQIYALGKQLRTVDLAIGKTLQVLSTEMHRECQVIKGEEPLPHAGERLTDKRVIRGPILMPEEISKYPEEWIVLSSGDPIKMLGHGKTPEEAIVSAGVDRANPCGWALWYHDGFTGIRI